MSNNERFFETLIMFHSMGEQILSFLAFPQDFKMRLLERGVVG